MKKIQAKHNIDRNVARFGLADSPELCKLVADSIPAEILRNARHILDVGQGCCGISKAIVNRLVNELDVSFFDAILRVHGVDTDLALTNRAKRLGFIHTTCADFLQWQPDVKFDVIVGNPPYQRDREVRNIGAPLWPDFIEKSMDILAEDGYLGFVIPATWMKRLNGKAWKVIKANDLVFCDPDVKWAFPNVGGNGGTFSVILLRKRVYQGSTRVRNSFSVNFHDDVLPTNNALFSEDNVEFLRQSGEKVMDLDVKEGGIKPSINSEHYSDVPTETHTYNIYYSGAPNRRSMWCDTPVGDVGKLKLVVPNSGNVYNNCEITEKGAGRQTSYVLGSQEELEQIMKSMMSKESKKLTELMAEGNYLFPLRWVVR
jgi:hypothetical protein